MKYIKFSGFIISILFYQSCNHPIKKHSELSREEIKYIQSLNLLDPDETIQFFYTNYNYKTAGNFISDKRIAHYWFGKSPDQNKSEYAYYNNILDLDTVRNPPGDFVIPLIRITTFQHDIFDVYCNGNAAETDAFFKYAMSQWKLKSNSDRK